mgnify:CR=1 FL=1
MNKYYLEVISPEDEWVRYSGIPHNAYLQAVNEAIEDDLNDDNCYMRIVKVWVEFFSES